MDGVMYWQTAHDAQRLTQAREALERAAVELDRADKQEVNRARAFDRATVELGEAAIDY